MIDEFRRRAAFGAQRLACRMRGIVFQSGEAATFDHRDRTLRRCPPSCLAMP
jgi:hypothetical protein